MRRVDADDVLRVSLEAHKGAGLGAVAVQHVGLESAREALELEPDREIRWGRLAFDRQAVDAELQAWRDLGQRGIGAFAAGEAVGENADLMTAIGLAIGNVDDVTENATDRRAHGVQDAERLVRGSHA